MATTTNQCPYCGQPITGAILARIRQQEGRRLHTLVAKAAKQAQGKYRRDLEEREDTLKKKHDETVTKIQLQVTRDRLAYQRKIKELERRIEKKTSNELGEGQELDLAQVLSEAFREDGI